MTPLSVLYRARILRRICFEGCRIFVDIRTLFVNHSLKSKSQSLMCRWTEKMCFEINVKDLDILPRKIKVWYPRVSKHSWEERCQSRLQFDILYVNMTIIGLSRRQCLKDRRVASLSVRIGLWSGRSSALWNWAASKLAEVCKFCVCNSLTLFYHIYRKPIVDYYF